MVGFAQCCILGPGYVHFLEQVIEAVVDFVFECGEASLDLGVGLLDGAQAGSRVVKDGFRSAVHWSIMYDGIDHSGDQFTMLDTERRVSGWCLLW
jgi:hypothetical protein